ncbi:MAG: 6-carboxytetrahydropterin synthase [Phycisphaerae bacterium]|nr:6-carboxytetrahydropterin synthase [Phycisphaerae bacterium]
MFRVCKTFDIESGHMISKHPSRCRYPHGHTRKIELVLASDDLNGMDMVVDFKWVKLAVGELLDRLDHALCVNSEDPLIEDVRKVSKRIIEFDGIDPTTEAMARYLYDHLDAKIRAAETLSNAEGSYSINPRVRLERVRVWETMTTWAEYTREP